MAAVIVARSDAAHDGPQPFDPSRHMRQVAELVASVFAEELDARGRGALREMQFVGRLSPMLGDALSVVLFNEFISGQVWVEGGQVVGNVTLQSIDQAGSRWRISNVAVLPSHRRRGIARALMAASLREIAQRGANWAVLQVRADNPAAHDLYLGLDFADVARDTIFRLPAPPADPIVADARLEPLRAWTGAELLELARASRSTLAQWADPVRAADYRIGLTQLAGEWLGRLTGLHRVERWGAWQDQQLMGAVETNASVGAENFTLRFAVRPAGRGKLEQALVAQGLRSLARAGSSVVLVQHDGDHGEGVMALLDAGFRVHRDLITMRRAVQPQDLRQQEQLMASADERMRILKMIANKQITAAEGARLLEALAAGGPDSPRGEEKRARWLRVKVTDRHSGRVKLNVTIPAGLIDVGLKMGARFAPEMAGMDGNVIQTAIRDGVQGRVLSVDDADDNERVEVYVE